MMPNDVLQSMANMMPNDVLQSMASMVNYGYFLATFPSLDRCSECDIERFLCCLPDV